MVTVRSFGGPRCFQTILTLDSHGANVLVDVGWDDKLTKSTLDALIAELPEIDIVLLTHSSLSHCGAFCYLRAKYPQFRAVPAFATLPVIRLGMLMTLDAYRSVGMCGPFDQSDDVLQIREIEQIWSEVRNVKYSQPVQIHTSPRLEGTVITAFNAGHSLGGSLWKVADGVDSIVTALEWNHARDAHLSGAFLEPKTGTVVPDLQKPSLLLTSTTVGSGLPLTRARQRFLAFVDDAIARGGTVLLPTSLGTRSLELLLVLEKHMSTHHGSAKNGVPLIFCSHFGKQALTQAASMLEWMVPSIMSDWQVQNESPFEQGRAQHVHDITAISQRWPKGPRVVLATGDQLESGFAQRAFLSLVAQDPASTVIFTEIIDRGSSASTGTSTGTENESLAAQLNIDTSPTATAQQLTQTLPLVQFDEPKPLSGKPLKEYRARQERERAKREQAEALERRNQQLIDTSATAEDDASESEDDELTENNMQTQGADVFLHGTEVYDYACPSDPLNERPIMFPTVLKRQRFDEYGDVLPHGMFNSSDRKDGSKKDASAGGAKSADGNEAETAGASDVLGSGGSVAGSASTEDTAQIVINEEDAHPMKMVKNKKKNLKLACWAVYADMNGLTNLRSMEMILKQVHPVRLVAIPANPEVCSGISNLCKQFAVADHDIHFERTNFSVNVRLDPSLRIRWQNVEGGYSVARIGGTLQFDPVDKSKRSEVVIVRSDEAEEEKDTPPSKRVAVGDLRLTALRQELTKKGMKAEFRGQGVLVCAEKIIVKKDEGNTFTLQGGVDPEYYTVRDAIRQFVALV